MIYQGNSKIKGIYFGGQKIKGIYFGGQKVYSSAPVCLPEVEAFMRAGGLDQSYAAPLDALVKGLKDAYIWDLMTAIYPMVGNSFDALKLNLKGDSNYDLSVWGGTPTMGLNSITATGILDTNIYGGEISSFSDLSISILSITNSHSPAPDICSFDYDMYGDDFDRIYMSVGNYGYFVGEMYSYFEAIELYTGNSTGFYTTSRTSSDDVRAYRNGVLIGSNSEDWGTRFDFNILIGGANMYDLTERTYTFSCIGCGLNASESAELYRLVNTFRNSL